MKQNNMSSVSNVIVTTRLQLGASQGKRVTQEQFAELVVEGLVNVSISRRSIIAWENGQFEPSTDLLLFLLARYYGMDDWRRTFAVECLKAKLPEVFDSGVIELSLPVAQ